jgi:hypothetical protein
MRGMFLRLLATLAYAALLGSRIRHHVPDRFFTRSIGDGSRRDCGMSVKGLTKATGLVGQYLFWYFLALFVWLLGTVLQGWAAVTFFPEGSFIQMAVWYFSPIGGIFFTTIILILLAPDGKEEGERLPLILQDQLLRGRMLFDFDISTVRHQSEFAFERPGGIFFGGMWLPPDYATKNFVYVGCVGSGKSMHLALQMKSTLSDIGTAGSDSRAVIYDPKTEHLSKLVGMGIPADRIVICNPYDLHSSAWDMARDIRDEDSAYQFSRLIIGNEKLTRDEFFRDGASAILFSVVLCLMEKKPDSWDLRDVVLCCASRDRIGRLVASSKNPLILEMILEYFGGQEMSASVFSNLNNALFKFRTVAALLSHAETKFSLNDFVKRSEILLLGENHNNREAIGTLNRFLLARVAQLVEGQKDSETRRTYIYVDEARLFGAVDPLRSLFVFGRSKGCVCTIAFQSFRGFDDIWGEAAAAEILQNCNNRGFFRVNDHADADRASRFLDETESKKWTEGHNTGTSEGSSYSYKSGSSTNSGSNQGKSFSQHFRTDRVVTTSDLKNIPLPDRNRNIGLMGYYTTPVIGAPFKRTLTSEYLSQELPGSAEGVEDFVPRPASHQELVDFSDDELRELGLLEEEKSRRQGRPKSSRKRNKTEDVSSLDDLEDQMRRIEEDREARPDEWPD